MRTVTRRRRKPLPASAYQLIETAVRRLSDKGSFINKYAAVFYLPQTSMRQRTTIFLPAGEVCEKAAASIAEDISHRAEIRPIIIVEDDAAKQAGLVQQLKQLANAFQLKGSSSAAFDPVCRLPRKRYLCPNRHRNTRENAGYLMRGQHFSPLLLDDVPLRLADKVCVKKCFSDRCSYASECAYAKHIDAFKSGKYKFQIYSGALYEKAWSDGEIPLKSTIIGADAKVTSCEQDTFTLRLSEQELFSFAHLSSLACRSRKEIKYSVQEDSAKIDRKAKKLFDKLCDGNRKDYLKAIAADISAFTEQIAKKADWKLKSNCFWMRHYRNIRSVLPIMAQPDTCFDEFEVTVNKRSFTFLCEVPKSDDGHPPVS